MRRGCSRICPNGAFPPFYVTYWDYTLGRKFINWAGVTVRSHSGQHSKVITHRSFVLADTEHLHRKIGEMGQRIRQLEDALSILQMNSSSEIHPLLSEELLAIKHEPEILPASRDPTGDHHGTPMDAFGTLTITDGGESNYFGQSGGVEV